MPANFFTEEIEIKDRVAIMLFTLNSVFVSTGRDSDISRSFLAVAAYEHCVTIKHFTDNKIETSLNLFFFVCIPRSEFS